jgi:protein-tyrosine phosphatase
MPTDLHCHVLPGVDDGPATLDDSIALARALVADGIDRVVATPHVNVQMPTSSAIVQERVALVRDALRQHDIPLLVEPGAEVAAPQLPELDLPELRALSLGGNGWILLEPPLSTEFPIERAAQELLDEGFGVVLAHPERCVLFQRDPPRVRTLVDAGARVQVTSSALTGAFGRRARSLALDLIRAGLVHNVASDAHGATRRPPTLLTDLHAAGLAENAEAWCETLPQAVLAGAA